MKKKKVGTFIECFQLYGQILDEIKEYQECADYYLELAKDLLNEAYDDRLISENEYKAVLYCDVHKENVKEYADRTFTTTQTIYNLKKRAYEKMEKSLQD